MANDLVNGDENMDEDIRLSDADNSKDAEVESSSKNGLTVKNHNDSIIEKGSPRSREDEEDEDSTIAEKRINEAHDIIHRVAAILAMEETGNEEPLAEVTWDGTLEGENIELTEDGEE